MLSRALRARTRQHISTFRLHPYQHFNHTLTSSVEEEDTLIPPDFYEKGYRRTAFIQTWEPIHGLADAWALLRAVERKYGKILEAQFVKDYEMNSKYQMYIYVCFHDPKTINSIPNQGCRFHIPAPVIEHRPGGLGLDDIKYLLESEDRDESYEFPPAPPPGTKFTERVIGARILPTPKDFFTLPKFHPTQPNMALARAFIKWGGFHKLEPVARSGNAYEFGNSEWVGKPVWEQVRMRTAMQLSAKLANVLNPAITGKRTTRENDREVSVSSPASASMDSLESNSPTARENDEKALDSSPTYASMDSPESNSPTARENDGKALDSSPGSASMDSPESSSPTTLDIPILHESTSKPTESHSLITELPQPPSQFPPEPTQLPPEPTPPGQLTLEQKKIMQRQMSRAKQLVANTSKQSASKKARKAKKEPEEKPKDQMLDESPEEPLDPASKGIVASFWKFLGR